MKDYTTRPCIIVAALYFLLAALYFSPIVVAYKLAFPLAFLTLAALRYSSWPIVLAMLFSALGDYMGVCHNFWGQMGGFALAHLAYILFFCREGKREGISGGTRWKAAIVVLYGIVVGVFIVPHVQGVLQMGVLVYILLILVMCILAWRQKSPYYALGAWLFVVSDTVLAWNKFVGHIEGAGYLIMVPYYLGQWILFAQSVRRSKETSMA